MSYHNSTPFQCHLEQDHTGRISRKIEQVAGQQPQELRYRYDQAGRLVAVENKYGKIERYEYDPQGRRATGYWVEPEVCSQRLEYRTTPDGDTRLNGLNSRSIYHDDNGFRTYWANPDGEEQYTYSPNYELLKVEKSGPNGEPLTIEFGHDHNHQRCEKYANGQLVERYTWHDLIRLARAEAAGQALEFHYEENSRLPYTATLNNERMLYLFYDQVGSLRVVADERGNVLKEMQYSSFGLPVEDTNPSLYMPIGFAGGLHDRDTGWVRMGHRDYDPLTARFTGKDPLGRAGGDDDLHGYCLDDPVNYVDPLGLFFGLIPGDTAGGRIVDGALNGALGGAIFGATAGPLGALVGTIAGGTAGLFTGTVNESLGRIIWGKSK